MSPELLAALRRNASPLPFTSVVARDGDDGPLHIAALRGHVDDVVLFLAHGAPIDQPGDMGFTALHYAVQWHHVALVELLVAKGARRDVLNEFGDTALSLLLKARALLPRRTFTALKQPLTRR